MRLVVGVALLLVSGQAYAQSPPTCPAGAEVRGATPPAGNAVWCEMGGTYHGPWTMWFPNGAVMRENHLVRGAMHGVQRTYHPRGSIASQRRYDHGTPVGPWRTWRADGSLSFEASFKRGRQTAARWFHPNGRLAREQRYFDGSPGPVTFTWNDRGDLNGIRTGDARFFGNPPRKATAKACADYAHSRLRRLTGPDRPVGLRAHRAAREILRYRAQVRAYLTQFCIDDAVRSYVVELCHNMDRDRDCADEELARARRDFAAHDDWKQRAYHRIRQRPALERGSR